jgi:ABC-type antimicrobial peptide transport system permease subunit
MVRRELQALEPTMPFVQVKAYSELVAPQLQSWRLGARRSDVVRLVAVQSSRAVIAGLILGGVVAFVGSRWISSMLYETSPHDPLVYSAAAVVLGVAAIVASIVPVRRSTAVDPTQAIRTE